MVDRCWNSLECDFAGLAGDVANSLVTSRASGSGISHRIRMYGRLMRTQDWGRLMVNGTPYIAYMDAMGMSKTKSP